MYWLRKANVLAQSHGVCQCWSEKLDFKILFYSLVAGASSCDRGINSSGFMYCAMFSSGGDIMEEVRLFVVTQTLVGASNGGRFLLSLSAQKTFYYR